MKLHWIKFILLMSLTIGSAWIMFKPPIGWALTIAMGIMAYAVWKIYIAGDY